MFHGMRTASKAPAYSPLNSGLCGVDIELLENRGHVPEQRCRKEPDVVTGVEYITDEPAETDLPDEGKRSWWRRNLSGWRGGLAVCIALTASVLAINIGFLIWAVLPSSSVKLDKKSGLGVLYRGDSDTMDELSRVIHLVVNVLGTLLLGASNYSLQIMLAPTRAEVDNAHRKRDWVNVGAQSLRNLKFIGRGRALVCAALAVSSLPLHLLYNSTIFPALGANEYFSIIVTQDFAMTNTTWTAKLLDSNRTLDFWQNPHTDADFQAVFDTLKKQHINSFKKMSSSECLKAYSVPFQSEYRSVIVVLSTEGQQPAMERQARAYHSMPFDATPGAWLCEKYSATRYGASCDMDSQDDDGEWVLMGAAVSHCLVQSGQPVCRIIFSLPLLLAVIAANVVKLTSMVIILCHYNQPTLVTLGDGIASFMEQPDPHTRDMCLWSKKDFRSRSEYQQKGRWSTVPKKIRADNISKLVRISGHESTLERNSGALLLYSLLAVLATTAVFFVNACKELKYINSMQDTTMAGLWALGLGTVKAQSTVTKTMNASIPTLVVLANLPQLALSVIYVLVNRLLSAMAAAREWASFAHSRKGLRVTVPQGQQRSTLWLQLPYSFAIPQLALSALLHYFVSQSLFLAQIAIFNARDETEDGGASVSSIGFSAIAIFCSLLTTGAVLVAVVLAGLVVRCMEGSVPVGFCSAAVAAACHPPMWEKTGVERELLQWGDVLGKDGFFSGEDVYGPVGHCSFSAKKVSLPEVGKLYA